MTFESICYVALAIAALTWTALTICQWLHEARKIRRPALELDPLRQDQYKQVAEWDSGPQGDDVDWERYEREMNASQWTHFGIYSAGEFCGCLSLEQVNQTTADFHVVTARRKVHPQELANLMLGVAEYLFTGEFETLTATIPRDRRAAARLALRCGMTESGSDESIRRFTLTKEDFFNGLKQTKSGSTTISANAATD